MTVLIYKCNLISQKASKPQLNALFCLELALTNIPPGDFSFGDYASLRKHK